MEIYAREIGGEEELLRCPGCGAADLAPADFGGSTGDLSWSLMSRLGVTCGVCGEKHQFSWSGRVQFRFARIRPSD